MLCGRLFCVAQDDDKKKLPTIIILIYITVGFIIFKTPRSGLSFHRTHVVGCLSWAPQTAAV